MKERSTVDIISAERLCEIICDGIRVEKTREGVDLLLPWHFGRTAAEQTAEPLRLSLRRVRSEHVNAGPLKQKYGGSVDDEAYEEYELTDNGRALAELARRVGDVTPYLPTVERLLYKTGMHTLRGGRMIVRHYDLYASFLHRRNIVALLEVITLIASLDLLPQYTDSEYHREETHPDIDKAKRRHAAPSAESTAHLFGYASDLVDVRPVEGRHLISLGLTLDGDGSVFFFRIHPDKTMTLETDGCFADWMWCVTDKIEAYTPYLSAVADRYGVLWEPSPARLSIRFRRNEHPIADALCRLLAATLTLTALEWHLYV